MSPKKTAEPVIDNYPSLLIRLCREGDVMVIPFMVTHYLSFQVPGVKSSKGGPRKGMKSEQPTAPPPTEYEGDLVCCPPPPPPEVKIVYERPDDRDIPLAVICNNIYVEYNFVRAVISSLELYSTVNCLKLENCCLSADLVESLALLLSGEPGRQITDLSLDGNSDLQQVVPLLLRNRTGLLYLSLRRCSLDDAAVESLVENLAYNEIYEPKLQILNLNNNRIGDMGAQAIARVLRTNRTLLFLSLAGNEITDTGAGNLIHVISRFPLTHPEAMLRRRKVFHRIQQRNLLMEKILEDHRLKAELESVSSSKTDIKASERVRVSKKSKSVDSVSRVKAGKERRRRSTTRLNQGEKFKRRQEEAGVSRSRSGSGSVSGSRSLADTSSMELQLMKQKVERELGLEKHPFMNEVTQGDGELWCHGNWRLAALNLAYNNLTTATVVKLTALVNYQDDYFRTPRQGLVRLTVQPGNRIRADSPEMSDLQHAMLQRLSRKESMSSSSTLRFGSSGTYRRKSSGSRLSQKIK